MPAAWASWAAASVRSSEPRLASKTDVPRPIGSIVGTVGSAEARRRGKRQRRGSGEAQRRPCRAASTSLGSPAGGVDGQRSSRDRAVPLALPAARRRAAAAGEPPHGPAARLGHQRPVRLGRAGGQPLRLLEAAGRSRPRLGRRDHRLHRQPRAARVRPHRPRRRHRGRVPPSRLPRAGRPLRRAAARQRRLRHRAAPAAGRHAARAVLADEQLPQPPAAARGRPRRPGLAGRRARLLGPPGRGGGHRRRRAARQQRRPPPVVPVAPDERPHRRLRRQRRQPHADPPRDHRRHPRRRRAPLRGRRAPRGRRDDRGRLHERRRHRDRPAARRPRHRLPPRRRRQPVGHADLHHAAALPARRLRRSGRAGEGRGVGAGGLHGPCDQPGRGRAHPRRGPGGRHRPGPGADLRSRVRAQGPGGSAGRDPAVHRLQRVHRAGAGRAHPVQLLGQPARRPRGLAAAGLERAWRASGAPARRRWWAGRHGAGGVGRRAGLLGDPLGARRRAGGPAPGRLPRPWTGGLRPLRRPPGRPPHPARCRGRAGPRGDGGRRDRARSGRRRRGHGRPAPPAGGDRHRPAPRPRPPRGAAGRGEGGGGAGRGRRRGRPRRPAGRGRGAGAGRPPGPRGVPDERAGDVPRAPHARAGAGPAVGARRDLDVHGARRGHRRPRASTPATSTPACPARP